MASGPKDRVVIGQISGLYGVRGWVRVYSYTTPRTAILDLQPWMVRCGERWDRWALAEGRGHGKGVVVRLDGIDDRDAAAGLIGADIAVRREQLPSLGPGEYYWTDLEGLRVRTVDGRELGIVDHLFETGANDVIVVRGERERLIPFIKGQVVRRIDLGGGEIEVDWDPDF
ncbi:MAG: ribosome maturation factor RimM [Gammaproteobacteria bacterium]